MDSPRPTPQPGSWIQRAFQALQRALSSHALSRAPLPPRRLGPQRPASPDRSNQSSCFSPRDQLDIALCDAARAGRMADVQALLRQGARPKAMQSQALAWAAEMGREDCLRLLLPLSDARARQSQALARAALHGHAACVALLIPASSPKACASEALFNAASRGHGDCARLLAPVSNPDAFDGRALLAASARHPDCVAALLRPQTPKAHIAKALLRAIEASNPDCFALLLDALRRAPTPPATLTAFCQRPWRAAEEGRLQCLALLLHRRPPSLDEALAARQLALSRGAAPAAAALLSFIERQELGALPSAPSTPARGARL